MTLIYVKDGKMSMRELAAMIDRIPEMDVFKLKRVSLDGTEDDIIALSKTLRGHPNLDELRMIDITLTDSSLNLDQVVSLVLVTGHGHRLEGSRARKRTHFYVHTRLGRILPQPQDSCVSEQQSY
jgi:hypothetical protein